MRRRSFITHGALTAVGLSACSRRGAETAGNASVTVLEVARANGASRFARAMNKTDLAEQFAGPGPFTLFAPKDHVFTTLPADTDELARLLAHHVVPGMLPASFLSGMKVNHTTAAGSSLAVDGIAGLHVNDAQVVLADLRASNGVVHVIDRVLILG